MEVIKDKELFNAVREEALLSFETDPETGARKVDAQKLISGPLLQSIYVEIMRMHVSFNVTREVLTDIEVDGYKIEKGSMLQSSSQIAHFEEAVWATQEHPASEFHAARHIKYVDQEDENGNITKKAQFSMKGRPSSFFPYGKPFLLGRVHSVVLTVLRRRLCHVPRASLCEAGDHHGDRHRSDQVRRRVCRVDKRGWIQV